MKIGVFDSGIGGLTVLKMLVNALPQADYLYVGDTARVPYGNKSRETVTRYSIELVDFLVRADVNAVVIACNTASALAKLALKDRFSVSLFEVIQPAVEAAISHTKNQKVGVIGTRATISSGAYERTFARLNPRIQLTSVACPLFVPLVEENLLRHPATAAIAQTYLRPLKLAGVDTLILGCTHYPLLRSVIQKSMGPRVQLISSAQTVADVVRRALAPDEGAKPSRHPHIQLWATDEPERMAEFARAIVGMSIGSIHSLTFKE